MIDVNITIDKQNLDKESRAFTSVEDKENAVTTPAAPTFSKTTELTDQKNLADEELIRLFLEYEDEIAFNEIVNRYADRIYRLALRITFNGIGAGEVLQQVFRSMEKLPTFRGKSKLSTWLYRITISTSCKHSRTLSKFESELSLEDYGPYDEFRALKRALIKYWGGQLSEVLLRREGREIMEKALKELSLDCRVVFHLRDIDGLSIREISKILDLSLQTVKSKLNRTRLSLMDKLSDYSYDRKKVSATK